jgi:hypothetical protein
MARRVGVNDGAIPTHDAMYLAKHVIGMDGYEELG